jgi:hypothetical protein
MEMAVDEQYAQALRELAAAKERIAELEAAANALLQWDRARNFIVPYRVRDPIIAALNRPPAASSSEGKGVGNG